MVHISGIEPAWLGRLDPHVMCGRPRHFKDPSRQAETSN
jgi:hypothetical protein